VYDDYRAMVADPLVQAVVVVTAPSLCHGICLAAAGARKPILIEKPLALSGREARAMVAAAEQAGTLLMTAQTMRFDPTVLKAKELLGTIGELERATLTSHIETKANMFSASPTAPPIPLGALLELGIHLLDLVRFLTGDEVLEVQCVMDAQGDVMPETRAEVKLRTIGGVTCILDIARVETQRIGTMEWIGSQGRVQADWQQRKVRRLINEGGAADWTVEARPTVLAALQAFLHAIRTETQPPITGLDGCRAVELADACYRSAAEGGRWVSVWSDR
jgi:predicted dehydrogenase